MSLYEKWKELAEVQRSHQENDEYWKNYFLKEQNGYVKILSDHENVISGTLSEVAQKLELDDVIVTGFIDGINSSLVKEYDLESLEESTEIKLEVDFEKLYFNMLEAKADWLYNLEEWNDVLSKEKRAEITTEFKKSQIAVSNKVGRNDPCTCGSGKKFKKCCGK